MEENNDFFDELNELYENGESAQDNSADSMLEGLNPEQLQAVTHLDGPILILAGAGSGKTRVITYRIAYMMKKHHVSPGSILAITFTNKAANEMRERITALVGDSSRYIWCGTFHSIFARILRRHAELLGYDSNFSIIDTDDQLKLIKQAMGELDISEKTEKPRNFQYAISMAKNEMKSPEQYEQEAYDFSTKNVARVYKRYTEKLHENNSMDFDDILNNTVLLLSNNPDIRDFYRGRFKYIMVDEYQDTNLPQYKAIRLLADGHRNICVVGDDDQSIYSFRGADVRMILNFEKDFKDCKVVKLEENYRSTKTILNAANQVIANNRSRKSKQLRTSGKEGDKIIVMNADDQNVEARFVAETIQMLVKKGTYKYSDVAVLYRMNALSRTVEASLREKKIPFKVFGGMRFYDRKEIKDVLAYLRIIADNKDNLAFERIINVPKRGIGDTTVESIRSISIAENIDMFSVAARCLEFPELSRSASKLLGFTAKIESFREKLDEDLISFADFIEFVENESGMIEEIIAQRETKGEMIDRVENLKELLSEAVEFEKNRKAAGEESNNEFASIEKDIEAEDPYFAEENKKADSLRGVLDDFLETAALYSEGDNTEETDDFVKLMSIHSAKGLEFGAVFLIGCEDGLFPSYKCIGSEKELEEERRLMYVAITRAKKNLFIVLSRARMLFGQTQCNNPSRFLKEIDDSLVFKMGTKRPEKPKEQVSEYERAAAKKSIESAFATSFTSSSAKRTVTKEDMSKYLMPGQETVGMRVNHAKFGAGVIIKTEPVAGDCLVTVDFDGMKKNMLLKMAKLSKV